MESIKCYLFQAYTHVDWAKCISCVNTCMERHTQTGRNLSLLSSNCGLTKHFDWACSTVTITCVHAPPLITQLLVPLCMCWYLTLSLPSFLCSSSSLMIIHVRLTLKQPLINCGSLGHTLGQITQLWHTQTSGGGVGGGGWGVGSRWDKRPGSLLGPL